MRFFLTITVSILIALAWLLPVHYRPWVTYTGELYAFLALFVITLLLFKQKVSMPKLALPLVLLAAIPLIQFAFGQIFFFSQALLAFCYVFAFWIAILVGYNLSDTSLKREQTFTTLSYVFLFSGTLTGLIAILQWFNLDGTIPGIAILNSARPYANFAQPNNMATFLLMSLLATLYLHEKKQLHLKWLVPAALIMLVAVALTQSRTSWLASLCVVIYLCYQQYRGYVKLRWYTTLSWLVAFIVLILVLPILGSYLSQVSESSIVSANVVQRATGDMSRLAIWQQMLHAIEYKPWFGYGFYQTGVAYTTISEFFQGPVWIRSAHNFIIDFLLWNGLLIGLPFLAYFVYWGYLLNKYVNSIESVIGLLMIGVFLVHALLEFPQNYAYFLLPVGFILGTVQAQKITSHVIVLPQTILRSIWAVGLVILVLVVRDYELLVPKLAQSMKYEKQPEKITNQDQIYILTEFNYRIDWVRMNPYTKVSDEQIQAVSHLVWLYPTYYNLYKFAQLLAYNGNEAEAKRQLKMLKILRNKEISYQELIEKQPNKKPV